MNGDGAGPSDLLMPGADGPGGGGDMTMVAGYPAGPYGNNVGDTFPPLVWEGYVAAAGDVIVNTRTYGPYSMNDARLSGKPYAMVHNSAFY